MLSQYDSKPALFYQKSPDDTDRKWAKPCYPRIDYNIDLRYDPERKTSGTLTFNVWCTSESSAMPEDIEPIVIKLVSGTFYTDSGGTVCAQWDRSDAFEDNTIKEGQGNPAVLGVTITFDLLEFPLQLTTDPDPIQGLNAWTKTRFPEVVIIGSGETPAVLRPTDGNPVVYWRSVGYDINDKMTSYAVNWYNGQFACHVIAESVPERNSWLKSIAERLQVEGEVILLDNSPMFIKSQSLRHNADPLREGQLSVAGMYGVLTPPRKEPIAPPLNHANFEYGGT
jgi:hypothetical protein